jgi:hypothetical protein
MPKVKVQDNDVIRCQLCGEEWRIPKAHPEGFDTRLDPDQIMFTHMMFTHPLDFLSNPKVQRGLSSFFENLGGMLADKLKGKINV